MQWRFELYILMVVPLLIALLYHMPHIIRRYVVCSNIELKKKKKVIDRVVRVVRTRKSIRMLRLLNSIKSYARRMQRMAHRQTGDKPKQTSNAPKQALSPETVREIEQVFQLFDKDGNGRVSAAEMVDLMQTLGIDITRETAQEIINEVDVDGDGELDMDEFIEFMRDEISDREKAPEETIEEMFALFDRDASGSISHHEFRTILMALGNALSPEDISELIRELDEDGNGEIDIEEFRHLVHKFS
ncbi:Calmodulin [Balamuthia mandrillaris]